MHVPGELGIEDQLRRACAELERRLRGGDSCSARELLDAFPDLAEHKDVALELIYTEFVIRQELGETPSPDRWHDQFPHWHDDLRQLFQVHDVLGDTAEDEAVSGETPASSEGDILYVPAGQQIGQYEVLEELGHGGMGVVYKARQKGLNRIVALKMISSPHAGPRERARFRAEAEAAARLQHPNIVQIHEVGSHDGQPYLTMELIDGRSLDERLAEGPLSAETSAKLVQTMARAVHAAHQHGIVHRDLKPANILLAVSSQPSAMSEDERTTDSKLKADSLSLTAFTPKITDFGLAKQLPMVDADHDPRDALTQTGAVLGTPSYMTPEQVDAKADLIGPATDVYALGVILYEAVTGRVPFRADTPLETLEQIRSQNPLPPTRLKPKLPRDLETICLKCLQKEPWERYASAALLADDLKRFLAGEPIQARPIGSWERLAKWARRRPVVATLIVTIGVVMACGFAGVTSQWLRAERGKVLLKRERDQKQEALDAIEAARRVEAQLLAQAESNLYLFRISLAYRAWSENNVRVAEQLLDECPEPLRRWEWHYLNRLCRSPLVLRGHNSGINNVAFSADGKLLASGGNDQQVIVWDWTKGDIAQVLSGYTHNGVRVAFSRDGRRLACAQFRVTFNQWLDRRRGFVGAIEIRDLTTGQTHVPSGLPVGGRTVLFSPNGRQLAVPVYDKGHTTVMIVDHNTGEPVWTLDSQASIMSIAFSPDGHRFAAGCGDDTIRLWDLSTGQELGSLKGHRDLVKGVSFSPDGNTLVSGSDDHTLRIWDLSTQKTVHVLAGHTRDVTSVAFSPTGGRIASSSDDRTVKVWDSHDGRLLFTLNGHGEAVADVAFTPDGRHLASCSQTLPRGSELGEIRVWDATTAPECRTIEDPCPAISPDGRIAVVLADRSAQIRSLETGEVTASFELPENARPKAAFSPDGKLVALCGNPRRSSMLGFGDKPPLEVGVYDVASGNVVQVVPVLTAPTHTTFAVSRIVFSRCGRRVAVAYSSSLPVSKNRETGVRVWDIETGQELFHTSRRQANSGMFAAFSSIMPEFTSDGKLLVTASPDDGLVWWDLASGQRVDSAITAKDPSVCGAYNATGTRLAEGSLDGTVLIWDTQSGRLLHELYGHFGRVRSVAFSPDGTRLATGGDDATARVWHVASGRQLLSFSSHSAAIAAIAFTTDGNRLVTIDIDKTAKIWDGTPLRSHREGD